MQGKARVRVEGMTCNRCVNFIQTKMKEVEGVVDILVSLEQSEAMVTFDRGVLVGGGLNGYVKSKPLGNGQIISIDALVIVMIIAIFHKKLI